MASIRHGTAALLIAGLALSATPAFADQHDRHARERSRSHHYDNRGHGSWNHGRYYRPGYRVYVPHRAYPYGWRPYGYRPGWSLNFYFGRPHGAVGFGGYYPPAAYGYYAIQPGVPYGSVRIVDAPRDAQVLVDGYYAGVVDDYDGVFQHLNLEPGAHRIEIQAQGFAPIGFDVRVAPGQTITYRANMY
jgi:hypothetical protein